MELRHLRYFIAVGEHMSFSKAAEQLHIAEPALNRQVRGLEVELETQLFVCKRRLVDLTDAGRILLREARTLVAQAARTEEAVRLAGKGQAGIVRIGIPSGMGATISAVLIEHARRFPAVEIQCNDIFSTLQNRALRERAIDVGFLRPPVDSAYLVSEPLFEEQFFILVSNAGNLAKKEALKLRDVAEYPLLFGDPQRTIGVYEKVLQLYRNAGLRPKIASPPDRIDGEAGLMLVAAGNAVSFRLAHGVSLPAFGDNVVAIPVEEDGATIEFHMAWRREKQPDASLAFMESARRVLKDSKKSLNNLYN